MESSPHPGLGADEWSEQLRALREQQAAQLRIQLALALAVGVFVWRSAVLQHRSLVEVRMLSARIQEDVVRQAGMATELQKIAVNRPEFAALLRKHGIAVPAQAPAPAPPPRP